MNYTETFEQFAARSTVTDLALYAGVAVIIWVLFKEKFSPITSYFSNITSFIKGLLPKNKKPDAFTYVPTQPVSVSQKVDQEDLFFQLVSSWKQTRDLALKSNCTEAVNVADQMFPYLSPSGCNEGAQK